VKMSIVFFCTVPSVEYMRAGGKGFFSGGWTTLSRFTVANVEITILSVSRPKREEVVLRRAGAERWTVAAGGYCIRIR